MYCEEIHFKRDVASIFYMHYIFLGAIFSLGWCCSGDECRNIVFKEPITNRAMENHVIRREDVPNEGSCRVLCYMEPNCVSINVGPLKGGTLKCELNNATDENTLWLKNNPSYTFLAIENPCGSSPCLNNGTCQAGYTGKGFRCVCHTGFTGATCHQALKKNCDELYKSGERRDGVYTIKPDNLPAFDAFCDQTTGSGGWTVFQKRLDGSVDFYLNWSDYKHGFGNLNGEFWLGLGKIYRLTSGNENTLRVDLEDFDGNTAHAEYDLFGVMGEGDNYQLILGYYSGTAGDSLSFHRSQPFSTRDQGDTYCARKYHGAWWYNKCHRSNLNGIYHQGKQCPYGDGVNWGQWRGYEYSLKRTEMKIRPKNQP